jgi:glutamyl-tRNA reductase
LILIDIAVPRDIAEDTQELENVYLYNIDHLEAIVRENSKLREKELAKCDEIIARRTAALMERFEAQARAAGGELAAGWAMKGAMMARP